MTPDRPREPSRDELLAMAYVDGELPAEEAGSFEKRLATEPALAREVAELQKLGILARQVAPPEPKDHEWARIERGVIHGTGWTLGWILTAFGSLALAVAGVLCVWTSDVDPRIKFCLCVASLGLLILFLLVLRARLRTLPFDPYTEVKR